MQYGFVNLQRIVEESIIAFVTSETVELDLAMRVRQAGRERRGKRGKEGRVYIFMCM